MGAGPCHQGPSGSSRPARMTPSPSPSCKAWAHSKPTTTTASTLNGGRPPERRPHWNAEHSTCNTSAVPKAAKEAPPHSHHRADTAVARPPTYLIPTNWHPARLAARGWQEVGGMTRLLGLG